MTKKERRIPKLSRLGLGLSLLYLLWALGFSVGAVSDGISCASIIAMSSDGLALIVATVPISFLASLLGINSDCINLPQLLVYIGLGLIFYYFLGLGIEKISRCSCQIIRAK